MATKTFLHDEIERERIIGSDELDGLDLVEMDDKLWQVRGYQDSGTVSISLVEDCHLSGESRRSREYGINDFFKIVKDEKLVCWVAPREPQYDNLLIYDLFQPFACDE